MSLENSYSLINSVCPLHDFEILRDKNNLLNGSMRLYRKNTFSLSSLYVKRKQLLYNYSLLILVLHNGKNQQEVTVKGTCSRSHLQISLNITKLCKDEKYTSVMMNMKSHSCRL